MNAILAYLTKFYGLAKSKVTTYVALSTAGLSELLGSWDQAAALFPHWLLAQKVHIVSVSVLLTIWSRIRKEL
jgi:aspartate-semialdehyde dehydrogenase